MFKKPTGNPAFVLLAASVERLTRPVRPWAERSFVAQLVIRTVREMGADDATHMAAGVAFYVLFSLFPLLLGLAALLSFFFETDAAHEQLTDFVIRYLPGSEEIVVSNIEAVYGLRGAIGLFAVLGLLWSGSAMFGAVNKAVNRAWDVHKDRPYYVRKPMQLLMAVGVSALFFLSMGAATVARTASRLAESDATSLGFLSDTVGRSLLQGTSLALITMLFLLIYKFMPNTKTYWRYIWPGAIVAAVLFEVTKNVFIIYVNRFANFENVYGSLAPVIAMLLWAYVGSLILILGAEISSEYGRLRRGVGRGELIHSKESS